MLTFVLSQIKIVVRTRFKKLSFILLVLSHFGLLSVMLYENRSNIFNLIFIGIAFVLLELTYRKVVERSKDNEIASLVNILLVFIGAVSTYTLHTYLGWSNVLAAATIGLLVSFIPSINAESEFLKSIPSAVFCGTFVGMTNFPSTPNYLFISVASIFTGLLLIGTKDVFYGYGGKLGSLAFGGVSLAFFIFFILLG